MAIRRLNDTDNTISPPVEVAGQEALDPQEAIESNRVFPHRE